MAVSFNLDGQALTFPDWASEATAEQMLDILKGIAKSSGASEKDQKKVTDSAKKTLDELKKGNANDDVTAEDQKKRDEKLLKENKKLGDGFKELGNQLEQYKVDKAFFIHSTGNVTIVTPSLGYIGKSGRFVEIAT